MKRSSSIFFLILAVGLFSLACGLSSASSLTPLPVTQPPESPGQQKEPTKTPALSPPTAIPPSDYVPAPRWMRIGAGQLGRPIEIAGEQWAYQEDAYRDIMACISYLKEAEPPIFFEQCFATPDSGSTYENISQPFRDQGFEIIPSQTTFPVADHQEVFTKWISDHKPPYAKFFEILDVHGYLVTVEMNVFISQPESLEAAYREYAADILDFVVTDILQKAHFLPSPTPTPFASTLQSTYDQLSQKLITAAEANSIYPPILINGKIASDLEHGIWEQLADFVDQDMVCREFEDRTNDETKWWDVINCVFRLGAASKYASFDEVLAQMVTPDDTELTSSHSYTSPFVIYGFQSGHSWFYAFLEDGDYVYFVQLEARTLQDQTLGDVFTKVEDDFIYDVLSINKGK
ncbi:MAG: hypothetical protein Fur0043_24030 [Anaerolineales bacterium]